MLAFHYKLYLYLGTNEKKAILIETDLQVKLLTSSNILKLEKIQHVERKKLFWLFDVTKPAQYSLW